MSWPTLEFSETWNDAWLWGKRVASSADNLVLEVSTPLHVHMPGRCRPCTIFDDILAEGGGRSIAVLDGRLGRT